MLRVVLDHGRVLENVADILEGNGLLNHLLVCMKRETDGARIALPPEAACDSPIIVNIHAFHGCRLQEQTQAFKPEQSP